jgi:hypothetical protein
VKSWIILTFITRFIINKNCPAAIKDTTLYLVVIVKTASGAGSWYPRTIWGVFVVVTFLEVFVFKTSIRGERAAIEEEIRKMKKE